MAATRGHFERVLAGERVEYERLAEFPRLGRRWIHAVTQPTFDAAGRADGWVGVVSDIHERKQAEQALAAARAQLQTIADSMSAGVQASEAPTLAMRCVGCGAFTFSM